MKITVKMIWIDMVLMWVLGISIYGMNLDTTTPVAQVTSVALFVLLGAMNGLWAGYQDWQEQALKRKSQSVTKKGYTLRGKGLKRYVRFRKWYRYIGLVLLQLFLAWACEFVHLFMDFRTADWTQCLINIGCTLGAMAVVKLGIWIFTKDL